MIPNQNPYDLYMQQCVIVPLDIETHGRTD